MTEIKTLHGWKWWMTLGILFLIVGLILLSAPVVATVATVLVLGTLFICAGILYLVSAIMDRHVPHFWILLLIAILTFVIGFLMIAEPAVTMMALTLMIGAFFLTIGIFRIVGSLVVRFHRWGWVFLNGIISLILGILIIMEWPASSFWVIGLFLGIDLLFAGWSIIMLSLFLKSGGRTADEAVIR